MDDGIHSIKVIYLQSNSYVIITLYRANCLQIE